MIDIQKLTVRAGSFQLNDFTLQVDEGSYTVIMGRTGCGKTTLLEAICGLTPVTSGSIHVDGLDITNLRPGERGIGYVPQEGALFQTMTVRENLAFGLRVQGMKDPVDEIADNLGIAHLLDRRPHGLSGGERQRVALGRALAIRPKVLCLDEPLSALDDVTREEITELLSTLAVTALHITHSEREAEILGDTIVKMESQAS